jgi:hypothetical protein
VPDAHHNAPLLHPVNPQARLALGDHLHAFSSRERSHLERYAVLLA